MLVAQARSTRLSRTTHIVKHSSADRHSVTPLMAAGPLNAPQPVANPARKPPKLRRSAAARPPQIARLVTQSPSDVVPDAAVAIAQSLPRYHRSWHGQTWSVCHTQTRRLAEVGSRRFGIRHTRCPACLATRFHRLFAFIPRWTSKTQAPKHHLACEFSKALRARPAQAKRFDETHPRINDKQSDVVARGPA